MNIILIILSAGLLGCIIALFFISRKSQKVMAGLLEILTRPERAKIQDASRVLQTVLSGEIEKISNNFNNMQNILREQINTADALRNDLLTRNSELAVIAEDATKRVAQMTQRLENTTDGFAQIVASNEWNNATDSAERFTARINDLLRNVDTTSQTAIERAAHIQTYIENWIENGRTLSENMESEYQNNQTQMVDLTEKSENLRTALGALANDVATGFENVKQSANDYQTLMESNDALLGGHIEKMDTFTKQAKSLLSNQMNTLTNTANVVGGQIKLAESSIEKQIGKLANAVDTMLESAESTEKSVRNVSNELVVLTNRFNGEINEFSHGIVRELNSASGVANTTLENTKNAANAFSESVQSMAIGVRETLMEMNAAHSRLSAQSENLIKMGTETTEKLEPLSELIEKYFGALPDMAAQSANLGENLEKIVFTLDEKIKMVRETVADSLNTMSDSSQKLEQISGDSRGQMIDLLADYARAVETMQTLHKQMMITRASAPMEAITAPITPNYGKISSDDFMRTAKETMIKMHEQSIDLTRSVGAEIPDTVLKKYHAGDTTIFTKWFAKLIGAADKKRVKSMLKSDPVFRNQASQFVRSFSKLVSAAEQTEDAENMKQMILKTDLGVIYRALKD